MIRILSLICIAIVISCNSKKETEPNENHSNTDTLSKKNKLKIISQKENATTEFDSIANRNIALKNEFKSFEINTLKDTLKVDLNGDKILDFAYFKNNGKKRELFILDGKSRKKIKIGEDKSFGEMSDDFSWVDFWGTTDDKETYEVLLVDSEIVGDTIIKLINKSIFVRKEEVGGGVITYKDNRFIWVHQSD